MIDRVVGLAVAIVAAGFQLMLVIVKVGLSVLVALTSALWSVFRSAISKGRRR